MVGEVEADRVGEVDVDLVREPVLLALAAEQPLALASLLGLLERGPVLALEAG